MPVQDWSMNDRAGTPAQESDLIDVDELVDAYYELKPDVAIPEQRVVFGTSRPPRVVARHRVQRDAHRRDHAGDRRVPRRRRASPARCSSARTPTRSARPAETTALEVLVATACDVLVDEFDDYVPTPALSHAIIAYNRDAGPNARRRPTASSSPRATTRRATAASSTTRRTAARPTATRPAGSPNRANELIADGMRDVKRAEPSAVEHLRLPRRTTSTTSRTSSTSTRSRRRGIRIGADPLGGASVHYWQLIARALRPRPHGREPARRPDAGRS